MPLTTDVFTHLSKGKGSGFRSATSTSLNATNGSATSSSAGKFLAPSTSTVTLPLRQASSRHSFLRVALRVGLGERLPSLADIVALAFYPVVGALDYRAAPRATLPRLPRVGVVECHYRLGSSGAAGCAIIQSLPWPLAAHKHGLALALAARAMAAPAPLGDVTASRDAATNAMASETTEAAAVAEPEPQPSTEDCAAAAAAPAPSPPAEAPADAAATRRGDAGLVAAGRGRGRPRRRRVRGPVHDRVYAAGLRR